MSEALSPVFRSEELYDYMVLLFAGMATIPTLIRKKSIVEPLWILFLGYCSLVSVRHLTIYVLVAAPIIAVELSEWWTDFARSRSRASLAGMLHDVSQQLTVRLPGTSAFIPLVIMVLAIAPGIHIPSQFPMVRFR